MKSKVLILHLLLFFSANAQSISKNMLVGDTVSDGLIKNIINYKSKFAKISDYKHNLLILDFWSTVCTSCIASFPKMDSLQSKFGKRIQIFPVTTESESVIGHFWKTNQYARKTKLPCIVEDVILNSYFKHTGVPHEVWIYKGKVIAITDDQYVDRNNIQKVLDGSLINWPVKNDFIVYDKNKSLFQIDNNQIDTSDRKIESSCISGFIENLRSSSSPTSGIIRNKEMKNIRSFIINTPILNAFLMCWNNIILTSSLIIPSQIITPNQIVWEVDNRKKYQYRKMYGYQQQWLRDQAICFESISPDTGQNDKKVYKKIISDLNSLLGLNVRWEKRNNLTYTLMQKKSISALDGKKGKKYWLSNIIYQLNQQDSNPYFFMDDNKIVDRQVIVDINSWTDINSVMKALLPYGYSFEKEIKKVDKFVFSEINGGLLIDTALQNRIILIKAQQVNLHIPSTEENDNFLILNRNNPGVVQLKSGLQYKIIKEGLGASPTDGDVVNVNYTGMLVNEKVFESSLETGLQSTFNMKDLIPGLVESLKLMKEGAEWRVFIPAKLAYADQTAHGKLPPNSTLIFDIQLLKVHN